MRSSDPSTYNVGYSKIFIGGLSVSTNEDSLKNYFEKYGEVIDLVIMKDKGSKFEVVDYVLSDVPHVLDGKTIDCKRAVPKETPSQAKKEIAAEAKKLAQKQTSQQEAKSRDNAELIKKQAQQIQNFQDQIDKQNAIIANNQRNITGRNSSHTPTRQSQQTTERPTQSELSGESENLSGDRDSSETSDDSSLQLRKIFVGGLPHNLPLDIFRNYFEQFGKLDDCLILQDKRTNKPRGFGFVTYNSVEVADRVMELKDKHVIQGKWVECKRAVALEQLKATSSTSKKPSPENSTAGKNTQIDRNKSKSKSPVNSNRVPDNKNMNFQSQPFYPKSQPVFQSSSPVPSMQNAYPTFSAQVSNQQYQTPPPIPHASQQFYAQQESNVFQQFMLQNQQNQHLTQPWPQQQNQYRYQPPSSNPPPGFPPNPTNLMYASSQQQFMQSQQSQFGGMGSQSRDFVPILTALQQQPYFQPQTQTQKEAPFGTSPMMICPQNQSLLDDLTDQLDELELSNLSLKQGGNVMNKKQKEQADYYIQSLNNQFDEDSFTLLMQQMIKPVEQQLGLLVNKTDELSFTDERVQEQKRSELSFGIGISQPNASLDMESKLVEEVNQPSMEASNPNPPSLIQEKKDFTFTFDSNSNQSMMAMNMMMFSQQSQSQFPPHQALQLEEMKNFLQNYDQRFKNLMNPGSSTSINFSSPVIEDQKVNLAKEPQEEENKKSQVDTQKILSSQVVMPAIRGRDVFQSGSDFQFGKDRPTSDNVSTVKDFGTKKPEVKVGQSSRANRTYKPY